MHCWTLVLFTHLSVCDRRSAEAETGDGIRLQEGWHRESLNEFACCALWTPIPPITWFLPFVGHLGICDSSGGLHDWGGGPIHPCEPQDMLFGRPARYVRFHPPDLAAWDASIAQADREFLSYTHCMAFGSDCHSHVARVLNLQSVFGCRQHNKVELAALVFFTGRHIGVRGFLSTWLVFCVWLSIFLWFRYS